MVQCLQCRVFIPNGTYCTPCSVDNTCRNCHRLSTGNLPVLDPYHRVEVTHCDVTNNFIQGNARKKFCYVRIDRGDTRPVCLCKQCRAYLYRPSNQVNNNNTENTWPTFVWGILRDPNLSLDGWALLPLEWRQWWMDSMIREHAGLTGETLNSILPVFYDATTDCKKDTEALQNNLWRGLMEREESLVIPTVKCPAGCSEFKHKCNDLPIDLVFQELLRRPITKLLKGRSERSTAFTRIFREDYCVPDLIANNPRWICRPTIAKTTSGAPVVLCCRHHSVDSKHQMIHPQRNPTGNLSSTFSGGLSPVIPVPRTIQKSKITSHAASFHMAHMEGSFSGIDTMYLSTSNTIQSVNSTLGWKQDVYSYQGRSDIKAYTTKRYKNCASPGSIGMALNKDVARYPYLRELESYYLTGSTYVSLAESVEMQKHINDSPPELGWKIVMRLGEEVRERVQFKGYYPRMLVYTHPTMSDTGCRPPQPPAYKGMATTENRAAWLLSSMILLVPEVWQAIAEIPNKVQNEWEGNLLTYLTKNCLEHIKPYAAKMSPFPKGITATTLLNAYFFDHSPGSMNSRVFRMNHLRQYLTQNHTRTPSLQIAIDSFPIVVSTTAKAIIITRDNMSATMDNTWQLSNTITHEGRKWKLCYIAETVGASNAASPNGWKGTIFCRHSNTLFHQWWETNRDAAFPVSATDIRVTNVIQHWDIAIYVEIETIAITTLRDNVLASCGGQQKVYCLEHNHPLICEAIPNARECSCNSENLEGFGEPMARPIHKCTKKAVYACQVPGCQYAICKKHHAAVVDWSGKYYVGEECGYGDIQDYVNDLFDVDEDANLTHGLDFKEANEEAANNNDDHDAENVADIEDDDNDNHDPVAGQFEAFFRLRDAEMEDLFLTENRAGTAEEGMLEPDGNYDGEVDLDPNASIPTTNPGTLPVFTYVDPSCDYASSTTSNHVLLNNFGHMLIRRNKKLEGTANQRNFLQRLVSKTPGDTLPLVYPEGMLFANMFNKDTDNKDIIGAIPVPLLNSNHTLASLGFASLQDHYRSRLSNPGIFASSDPKYHLFAFDCLSNLSLRGCDSRVILHRGFAENQGDGGVRFKNTSEERIFDTEHVDSSDVVNKLAASINERAPSYFYTHTCNMKGHYGMKYLWDWLTGAEILTTYCEGHESEEEKEALRRNIVEGNGVLLLRAWMEVMHIWINYITKSPEQPIGEVDQFLFRMELQDATANLPHLHAMLWTRDNLSTEAGLQKVLDRIRGFIGDIIRKEEREKFKTMGVFEDDVAVTRFLTMVETFLTHHHTRRCVVVKKSENESDEDELVFRCKANNNRKDNPSPAEHSFVELPIKHSSDAVQIMVALDLGSIDHTGKFTPSEKCLQAVKHYPPAHANEGIISPVFASLLPLNPCMGNAQYASGYTLSRYLAKYIVSIDYYNTIRISPPKPEEERNTFNVYGEELANQKITGNRIHQRKKQKTEKPSSTTPSKRQGRAFNVAEFYMLLFGYTPIMTNIAFVNVSTKPYDERGGRDRVKPITRIQKEETLQNVALTPLNCLPAHTVRINLRLPPWRQFLDTQIEIAFDDLQCPVSVNKVTTFSVRPPELMFVARHQDYRRWFVENRTTGSVQTMLDWCDAYINPDHNKSLWIDGFASHIQVRAAAVEKVLECLLRQECSWFQGYNPMTALFQSILSALQTSAVPTRQERSLVEMFVTDIDNPKLPVVWFQPVRPTFNTKFLIHLLLSMGQIKDEYNLFGTGDLQESFVKAGLLDRADPMQSAVKLSRAYVLEQLASMPKGTPTFDRYLVAAHNTIVSLFVHNQLFTEDLPLAIYCRLCEQTEAEVNEYRKKRRSALISNCLARFESGGLTRLPTAQQCMNATIHNTVNWDLLQIPQGTNQPSESYEEQLSVLRLAKHLIDDYTNAPTHYTKGLCQVGAGGVGKTFILFLEIFYSMCQGLLAAITAINSERAQELGGIHIHEMFAFQGRELLSPGQLAERACAALYKRPQKLHFLRTLDVLGLDEAGAIPCEILNAMCIVLRYIRGNNMPFGGLLMLASKDLLQLEPVSGRHPLMSPSFTTCFYFRELIHSVRAATDLNWQRLQKISRMDSITLSADETREEFISLLTTTCSFVPTLDHESLPDNVLFTFGKRAPVRTQERRIMERLLHSRVTYRTSTALDEEKNVEGFFRRASTETTKRLNHILKEPEKLIFYEGGRYQLTYNSGDKFSNSQLAMLFELPTQEHVDNKQAISMIVAPAGSRFIPDGNVTIDQLTQMGWKRRSIAAPVRRNVSNTPGGTRGRRKQYGLRHHVGSTFHGVQGQTLESLITRIERGNKAHPYSLWLSSQVVVLLSRTRRGEQTYFWVPDGATPRDVAETLYDLLCITSPLRNYLTHLLQQLCNTHPERDYTIDHVRSIYRPNDIAVPTHQLGYVYMLISTKDLSCIYIGSTRDLIKRWRQHNTGYGAKQTHSLRFRPWALLAYVVGFDGEEALYRSFENEWIRRKQAQLESGQASVVSIHNLGKDIVQNHNSQSDTQLQFVSCGTVTRMRAGQNVI